MAANSKKNRRIFLAELALSVLVGICLIVAGYVFYQWRSEQSSEQSQGEATTFSLAAERVHDLDMARGADLYKQLAAAESDPMLRTRYLIREAMSRNATGDYRTGIASLKAIVADSNTSSQLKAEALIAMVHIYYKERSIEPLQVIFEDSGIYADALAGGDLNNLKDLEVAVSNLYKTASAYHEYAFTEYARARFVGARVLDNPTLDEATKQSYLAEIKMLVLKGDELLNAELEAGWYAEDPTNTLSSLVLSLQHYRLFALQVLARTEVEYRDRTENYFADLMQQYLEGSSDYAAVRSIEAYTRFYHAAYLADVYGTNRLTEIQELMAPLSAEEGPWAESNAYSIWPFFERVLKDSDIESYSTRAIFTLAGHDPSFKALLLKKNWIVE